MRVLTAVVIAGVVLAVDPARADDGAAGCSIVTNEGYCGVEFGMGVDDARKAFPGGLPEFEFTGSFEDNCYYLGIAKNNFDVAFMIVYGVVERIDVSADWASTAEGAKTGMTLDEVEALYPGSIRRPNFYSAPDEDLIVNLGDDIFAVFQTSFEGSVDHFHVGRKPAVDYVEGCA